jgi:type IV pilus secretin PilQ/predicted competence protein
MCRDKSSNKGIRFGKDLLVWGLVLIVMTAIAIGQDEQGPATENATVETVVAANVNEPKAGESGGAAAGEPCEPTAASLTMDGKIKSISFKKDMRIQETLQFLAARYQKNIVPSSKVDGMITVTSLYDVTFEQALNAILGTNFKYEQEGNFIKVYTADEFKKLKEDKERMITRVFTLYYISAAEALKLIGPTLSGAGTIQGSSPTEKIMPTGESISIGAAGGDTIALNDTIVVLDYPENMAKVEKLLKELDTRPKQVLIEATILSATLTEQTALGIDWSTISGVTIDTIANVGAGIVDGVSMYGFASKAVTEKGTVGDGLNIGITSDHVAALIRALESVTDLTVIANPKILAINKQLGQVYIGKKYGYQSQTTVSEGGASTSQVSFLETGTKLSFRPYIGNDGYIRMDIHPKDSDGSVTNGLPSETSLEVATNIIVKDGQTIVIGGLFRDTVDTTRHQVPLLGNLPIIGAVFRTTVDKVKREEVIVMLTPHIIEESAQTEGLARAEDMQRKRFGAKDTLQGFGRAKLAEDHYAKAAQYFVEGNNESATKELDIALTLRPTYLEALRLKERILAQTNPDEAKKMERVILEALDREEAPNWQRR